MDVDVWVIFILVIWKRNTKVEEDMNNEMEITYIIRSLYIVLPTIIGPLSK